MDSVYEFLQNVPQPVQWAFAGIGALFLGSKILSYLQLVLNTFVLPGTNVRTPRTLSLTCSLELTCAASQVW